jgi:hypothetical protein
MQVILVHLGDGRKDIGTLDPGDFREFGSFGGRPTPSGKDGVQINAISSKWFTVEA